MSLPEYVTDIGRASPTEAFNGTNYAVQMGRDGPIKIGFTNSSAKHRCRQLQASCPYQLHVLAEWPATERHEKRLHEALTPYRLRNEWYFPAAAVVDALAAEQRASVEREPARLEFIRAWTGKGPPS